MSRSTVGLVWAVLLVFASGCYDVGVSPSNLTWCCDPDGDFPQNVGTITITNKPRSFVEWVNWKTITGVTPYSTVPSFGNVRRNNPVTVQVTAMGCGDGVVTVRFDAIGMIESRPVAIDDDCPEEEQEEQQ